MSLAARMTLFAVGTFMVAYSVLFVARPNFALIYVGFWMMAAPALKALERAYALEPEPASTKPFVPAPDPSAWKGPLERYMAADPEDRTATLTYLLEMDGIDKPNHKALAALDEFERRREARVIRQLRKPRYDNGGLWD